MSIRRPAPKAIPASIDFLRDPRLSPETKCTVLILETYGDRRFTNEEIASLVGVSPSRLDGIFAELAAAGYLIKDGDPTHIEMEA